jgi:hypothetical protein
VTGTTTIDALTGTVPFVWLVFDGALTLTHSANLICPGSTNMTVAAGDVAFFLNDGSGVWRVGGRVSQVLLEQANDVVIATSDARTNTVDAPLTIKALTTNTPAAGIGIGTLYQAESADEAPSNFGQTEFVASDVSAGSEDTYFQILLRVAGAALAAAYRWVATTAYKAIFTHANSADRTYTLANRDCTLGHRYDCPTSAGSGSTRSHEGTVTISVNQALSGGHFYTNFTLNSGVTITPATGSDFLAIYATGTITINGTIAANAIGQAGGAAEADGTAGTDQPGGAGGAAGGGGTAGGSGGAVVHHGISRSTTQVTGSDVVHALSPFSCPIGGAGGGGGGAVGGGSSNGGGRGGGSIILVAPTVILGASSVLNTSGGAGTSTSAGNSGGGGGGGAGNIYIFTHSYTDNGATFTQNGGAGGTNGGGSGAGGSAGSDGVKQINIY